MSQPYVGEIRAVGFTFAPPGYFTCDGRLLPISQYDALFTLLGTTYGGDGVTTFALPDLRGRLVVSQGTGPGLSQIVFGQTAATESVTLLTNNLPSHAHLTLASTAAANTAAPGPTTYLAAPVTNNAANTELFYLPNTSNGKTIVPLDPSTVGAAGNSLPHENRMPFLAINYIIAWSGIFPSFN